jgi:uncharacterized DUF497 family protein
MESFEWDPEKRWANLQKHGLDFVRASRKFDGQVHQYPSNRGHEERWVAVGVLDGEEIAVILYSARPSNPYHLGAKGTTT